MHHRCNIYEAGKIIGYFLFIFQTFNNIERKSLCKQELASGLPGSIEATPDFDLWDVEPLESPLEKHDS